MKKYTSFMFEGKELEVGFIETIQVVDGVECDVYEFTWDTTKDLWIIKIAKNSCTPKQLVLKWGKTIEGYVSWKWKLVVEKEAVIQEYNTTQGEELEVIVNVWEKMQWFSDSDSELVAYEICFPPYEDGRYQDL